jgi:hypothetical protein
MTRPKPFEARENGADNANSAAKLNEFLPISTETLIAAMQHLQEWYAETIAHA